MSNCQAQRSNGLATVVWPLAFAGNAYHIRTSVVRSQTINMRSFLFLNVAAIAGLSSLPGALAWGAAGTFTSVDFATS